MSTGILTLPQSKYHSAYDISLSHTVSNDHVLLLNTIYAKSESSQTFGSRYDIQFQSEYSKPGEE